MAGELFAAIKAGDNEETERMLGADPTLVDVRDEQGLSPTLVALYHGKNEIAKTILARGPKLDVFEAAAAGDTRRVRELVGQDHDLANAVAPDGFSPLGLAAFFKRREIVRFLLEMGADPQRASRQGGFTPLHSAVATDAGEVDVEIVRLLLDKGADPNARAQSGSTPLHTVAFTGDRKCLDLLLSKHASPAIWNNDDKTAEDIARERGHGEIADLLAARAADE
jgi:ankyrin repeat protein